MNLVISAQQKSERCCDLRSWGDLQSSILGHENLEIALGKGKVQTLIAFGNLFLPEERAPYPIERPNKGQEQCLHNLASKFTCSLESDSK
jgi:hypothetical protein